MRLIMDNPNPSKSDYLKRYFDTWNINKSKIVFFAFEIFSNHSLMGRLTVSSIQCRCASKSPNIGGLLWPLLEDRRNLNHSLNLPEYGYRATIHLIAIADESNPRKRRQSILKISHSIKYHFFLLSDYI